MTAHAIRIVAVATMEAPTAIESAWARRAVCGFTLRSSIRFARTPAMTDPYIRASELKDFSFCRRAWFLERQGEETTLTDAREFGTTDHAQRAIAVGRGQTLHGASRWILKLAWIAAALLALGWLLHR